MKLSLTDLSFGPTTVLAAETEAVAESGGIAAGAKAIGFSGFGLAAQIINFIILLLLLRHFLYRPLVALLEKRRQAIIESSNQAEMMNKQFADFKVEHQKRLSAAKEEAAALVNEAKRAADAGREAALAEARAESEALLVRATGEIERQRVVMRQELKKELAELVVATTAKLIGRELKPEDEQRLAKEALAEVQK